MSDEVVDVVDRIVASFRRLTSASTFADWLTSNKGTLLVHVNHPVIILNMRTRNSPSYLASLRELPSRLSHRHFGGAILA